MTTRAGMPSPILQIQPLQGPRISRREALGLGLCAGAVAASGLTPATAQTFEQPVVIEMFTSQGCSSCPPADKLLMGVARRANVIAMSLPVDYWDYIGWKDTFGKPEHTLRQKGYAKTRGDGQIYTPQAVVDGVKHVVGSNMKAIEAAASGAFGKGGTMMAPMKTSESAGKLVVEIGAAPDGAPKRAELMVFRVLSSCEVQVGRGENSGKRLTYANVVRSIEAAGAWTGQPARFEIARERLYGADTDGWVLLLQAGSARHPGVILAAAKSPNI